MENVVRDYNNYGIDRHAYGIMVLIVILLLYQFSHVIELCHVSCTIELEGKVYCHCDLN